MPYTKDGLPNIGTSVNSQFAHYFLGVSACGVLTYAEFLRDLAIAPTLSEQQCHVRLCTCQPEFALELIARQILGCRSLDGNDKQRLSI